MSHASRFAIAALSIALSALPIAAQEPVFSGPQPGERLPPLSIKGVFGDHDGKTIDVLERAGGKPVLIMFAHRRTRPAFGLANTVSRYAAKRSKDGLTTAVVFLTDDPTATTKWMNVVKKYLPQGVIYGVSNDGPEGPGAYGLNRNVTLTVLVGNKGKVTANFALVQPSVQADGPNILKAVVDVMGGGKVPTLDELVPPNRQMKARGRMRQAKRDPKLTPMLRELINKQATKEQVEAAAKRIDAYVAEHEAARRQLGAIAQRIVTAGKLENYGTSAAQDVIKRWSETYSKSSTKKAP